MGKLKIIPGKKLDLGKKFRSIVKKPPADGTDLTAELKDFLETFSGKIKVYVDNKPGLTKIVLPSTDDLEESLKDKTPEEQEKYLASMGASIMRRCG